MDSDEFNDLRSEYLEQVVKNLITDLKKDFYFNNQILGNHLFKEILFQLNL